jgi:tetratricopeptide (TPR) repeat protein
MTSNNPAEPGAILADAMARHQAGDLDVARPLYRQHLDLSPDDANAWCLLAALEGQTGDHSGAGEAFRQASEADPDWAPAYAGLGTSLLLRGESEQAVPALRKALDLKPDDLDARMQLALACRRTGRTEDTIAALEEVLRRKPDHPDARYLLAATFLESGQALAAENCYRAVIGQEPDRARAYLGLSGALLSLHRPDEAEELALQATRIAPTDPDTLTALGHALKAQGRLADAEIAYGKALPMASNVGGNAKALSGLAELDRLQGRSEVGMSRLQALLDDTNQPSTIFLPAIRLMIDLGRFDEALEYLKTWQRRPDLGPNMRQSLLSFEGRLLDRLGRVDEAWKVWGKVNVDAQGKFDSTHYSRAIDRVCNAFPGDIFSRLTCRSEWMGAKPVLIVGTPRSGKSVLEQILACHPQVHGGGELRLLGQMTDRVLEKAGTGAIYPNCVTGLQESDIAELSDGYSGSLSSIDSDVDWITDTQPTNFLHLGLATLVCPDLRVIFCRRDPLDVAWACHGRAFNDPALAFVASPEGLGHYLTGMERLAQHWKKETPAQILDLNYEDLVADPETVMRRVVDFLGLPWSDLCMQYHQPGRASLSVPPTVTRPLTIDEVGQGARYRHHLSALEAVIGREP